jgi:GNAT superfamily N-acetyltransferase/ribosomal protein S27AE
MNVRVPTTEETAEIRAIAERSFQTSYALSPLEIETIVENVFTEDVLTERIDDDGDGCVLVAESEDEAGSLPLAGFAELEPDSTLRWLHVDPACRGRGAASALFGRARTVADESNQRLSARILEAANQGTGFLEQYGLKRADTARLEFDEVSFVEYVYRTWGDAPDPNEPDVDVPSTVTVDGVELLLSHDNPVPGTEAPFFTIHEDDRDGQQYGFLCSSCGSTDVSADGLDRLECDDCGNTHLADQWDDAYL